MTSYLVDDLGNRLTDDDGSDLVGEVAESAGQRTFHCRFVSVIILALLLVL